MANVKVVVGANFGDEGKGLMTDFFCHQANENKQNCIVVMSNGGAQRGHTVNLLNGKSHIFKHFSSGTFAGADTYCPSMFIINPIQFMDEFVQLQQLGHVPTVYVDPACSWSTPFDMIINQIVESFRGDKKHGSCGMGIWETIVRITNYPEIYSIYDFNRLPHDMKFNYILSIRNEWLPKRLKMLGIDNIPSLWIDIINSDTLIENFINDIQLFCERTVLATGNILNHYQNVVFENGQGLLLDQNAILYGDNTTPSNTGIQNAVSLINKYLSNSNIEFCYVTRSYMTRHGAGRFVTECKKDSINSDMFDETNISNPFQGRLRYGELDLGNLKLRVENDLLSASAVKGEYKTSVAVTHLNELQIDCAKIKSNAINNIYTSNSRTRESVKVFKEY